MPDPEYSDRRWENEAEVYLDLRELEPPEPMVEVLTVLDRPGENRSITVILSRDPIFLFPEIEERGWQHEYLPSENDDVRLLLTRS